MLNCGAAPAATFTVKLHELVPTTFVAVDVTWLVPIGNA
jgi:hypothetical protein